MSLLIEQDSEVALLHRGTRRFLLVGFLTTLLIVAAIFVRQGLLRQTANLNFVTDSAQDINKGQSVKIAGFKVGVVDEVTLQADGQVAVELNINADSMRFVTRDAVIELHKEGLVGSAVLEIVPGADRTRLAANGARLNFRRADGLTATVNSLRDKITPILDDIKTITGSLADTRHGLVATLGQMREATATLDQALKTTNRQLEQVGGAATRAIGKAESSLTQLDLALGTVNARLPGLIDKADHVVQDLGKLTANMQDTVPPLLQDSKAVVGDVREILTGAKSTWPIKNLVGTPPAQSLKADSDPRAEAGRGAR